MNREECRRIIMALGTFRVLTEEQKDIVRVHLKRCQNCQTYADKNGIHWKKTRFRALKHKIREGSHYIKTFSPDGKLQVSLVITGNKIKIQNPDDVVIQGRTA